MASTDAVALRAPILHFTDEPDAGYGSGYQYFPDGVLLVEKGRVRALDSAEAMAAEGFDLARCLHFPNRLLIPGLIDTHIHYPQTEMIASYGRQLIDWLQQYTYPTELKYADDTYAAQAAERFLDILLASGTTSAMVYTSVFPQSTEAFFRAARARHVRMIAGKVLMDRNAPQGLLDQPESVERECRRLIERWHRQGRLHYALTPRFAPTSTPEQLALAGRLYREYPDLYLQTHLSENRAELAWVRELFPGARDYLDVYDQQGLLGPKTVFGHGLYLSEREVSRLADTQSRIAFCPTSNLFLGSGLLDVERLRRAGVPLCLATDVGGGTSVSMLSTLAEAYKVLQLQGQSLHPLRGFYLATLGNARALGLDHCLGNLEPGKEADFVLLDMAVSPAQAWRQSRAGNLAEQLFALMMMGNELNVARTYIMGRLAWQKKGWQKPPDRSTS